MDSRMGAAANYQMSYFQPPSELIQEEDSDTLILDLAGFKKEQLKAQLAHERRILKISGARQLENNRWIRFDKDFLVSSNCDTQKISARFDDGMLFVNMPKLITPAEKEDSKLPPLETQQPEKPTEPPVDAPEKYQEQASQKTLASDVQNKHDGTKNFTEKSPVKEETKTPYAKSQEQAHKKTLANGDKKGQIGAESVPEKSMEKEKTKSPNVISQERTYEKTLANGDKKKQLGAENVPEKSLEKEETESSNAESQDQAPQKTFASDDQNKQTRAENVPEKSLGKEETESSNEESSRSDAESSKPAYTKYVNGKSTEDKHDNIDENQKAERSLSDKGEKVSSSTACQKIDSWGRAIANAYAGATGSPAAKLKMARQMMNIVLSVLLAFLLGLYFSHLVRNSKKAEN